MNDFGRQRGKTTGEYANGRLFTEANAKSVEMSGYTIGRQAPQSNVYMPNYSIPGGVGKFVKIEFGFETA